MDNLELLLNICKDYDKCLINSDSCNIDILYNKYLNNQYRSDEDIHKFIHQPMMTMMGNKRKLLSNLEAIINKIKIKEKRQKINIFDAFCGSTVCSRLFTKHASKLYTNDMEQYSYLMAKALLEKPKIYSTNKNKQTHRCNEWSG